MKKVLVVGLLCITALTQAQNQYNINGIFNDNNSASLAGAAFVAATIDTTEALYVPNFKTLYVNVFAADSCTILIKYQLSSDGSNWTAVATKDSLSHGADGYGFKSVDFTSTVLGAQYVRFHFDFDVNAFAIGSTSATYTPSYVLKRY